jgi:N-acetylneuraminic acid mutarotase
LKSVERFDPCEPQWVQLEEMSAKRGGLSAAVLNEKLYAIGGFDGSKFLSSVEVFDPRAGSWLTVDSIASPRAYGDATVLGDSIYMIGGLGGIDYVDSVESYQDGVGWEVSSQAIGKRSFLTAVVL